jgi:thiamine biosynthesis lipoprotein
MTERHRFDAMGTWVECLVEAPPSRALRDALHAVEAEFERLERLLSRFRPESELARLNRERSLDEASDDLLELVALAREARDRTGGRFDPTLGGALVTAGYDRTFAELARGAPGGGTPAAGATPPAADAAGGELTVRGRRIELGPGASLDLGGIAKGFAADRCAAWLDEHGPALVNAGGDLAVSAPRSDGPWPVAVDVPRGTLTLAVGAGGLATSGRDRRRWLRDGEERHHLIDPATLRPAEGGPLAVTVAGPSATAAEVSATALFLAGAGAAREAERARTPAVIVTEAGDTRLVGGLA